MMMMFARYLLKFLCAALVCSNAFLASADDHDGHAHSDQSALYDRINYKDPLPLATRAYWMRRANDVNYDYSPCPFMAFGTVIVNHTSSFLDPSALGEEICTGLNHNNRTGTPYLDGEMSAIANCSDILTDPKGLYKLSAPEAVAAYADFSIYTNGEPCPMCASAINWAGFKEMIFGSSIETLVARGWPQIRINSIDVFKASWDIASPTAYVGSVLANETDPWFDWQFQPWRPCPAGCARPGHGERCAPVEELEIRKEL